MPETTYQWIMFFWCIGGFCWFFVLVLKIMDPKPEIRAKRPVDNRVYRVRLTRVRSDGEVLSEWEPIEAVGLQAAQTQASDLARCNTWGSEESGWPIVKMEEVN